MIYTGRMALTIQDCTMEEAAQRIHNTVLAFCNTNKINTKNILAIIFSQTKDIADSNPAFLLRQYGGFSDISLFCTVEPEYEQPKFLAKTIRMLVVFKKFSLGYKTKSVYMYGAEVLRPDLTS